MAQTPVVPEKESIQLGEIHHHREFVQADYKRRLELATTLGIRRQRSRG